MTDSEPIRVYYDGECPVCSGAVCKYADRDRAKRFEFIDINSENFDPEKEGISHVAAQKEIHVRRGDRTWRGLDGLIVLWSELRGYGWRARIASLPIIHFILDKVYRVFAANRHRI